MLFVNGVFGRCAAGEHMVSECGSHWGAWKTRCDAALLAPGDAAAYHPIKLVGPGGLANKTAPPPQLRAVLERTSGNVGSTGTFGICFRIVRTLIRVTDVSLMYKAAISYRLG